MKKTLLIVGTVLVPLILMFIVVSLLRWYLIAIGDFKPVLKVGPFLTRLVFWAAPILNATLGFLLFRPIVKKKLWLIGVFYFPLMFFVLSLFGAQVLAAFCSIN
jgi:hypothetical protein